MSSVFNFGNVDMVITHWLVDGFYDLRKLGNYRRVLFMQQFHYVKMIKMLVMEDCLQNTFYLNFSCCGATVQMTLRTH